MDYVVRVKGSVHIQSVDGYRGALLEYPFRKVRYVLLPRVRYRSDAAAVVNLALCWGKGHKEPWYLATGLGGFEVGGGQVSSADATGAGIFVMLSGILRWIVPQ